jgi:hypothetical protein
MNADEQNGLFDECVELEVTNCDFKFATSWCIN